VAVEIVVALFAGVIGAAMAGIWTRDILSGVGFDPSLGLLRARESETGDLMVWHWLAEYGTAGLLVLGAILLLAGAALAVPITLLGLGSLVYSSANSLGWALARPERRPYAIPMAIGLVGGLIGAAVLLLGL
jgi:hypothetical protein